MEFDGFDWDHANRGKCQAHRVSLIEIEDLFFRTPRIGPDFKHSLHEQRLRAVGMTKGGRNLFVVFTVRHGASGTLIRPISARYMHRKEVVAYEKAFP